VLSQICIHYQILDRVLSHEDCVVKNEQYQPTNSSAVAVGSSSVLAFLMMGHGQLLPRFWIACSVIVFRMSKTHSFAVGAGSSA
jgi:hypothetical protein